ncbi:MAG: long-chain fatty acid--CoA ligase [Candidatus Ratteibacteria bacterium]|nr:long-chain fatty acid--CoA ligase [Candidatus Ratteibacteria bacterium]
MRPLYEQFNSLGQMLQATAENLKDRPAVIFNHHQIITYRQLEALSSQIANFLVARGIQKGDRICLYCINSPYFIAAYFGIVKAGATVVPINLLLNPEEIHFIISDSGAKGLFYFEALENNINRIKDTLTDMVCMVAIEKSSLEKAIPLSQIKEESSPHFEVPEIDQKEDVAAILYTSGTTGYPKGAMLTHRNLLFNVNSILQVLKVDENDIFLTVLPLFHAFGATAGMISPIAVGATIATVPKFIPIEIAEVIKETGATIFLGVPSMYKLLADLPDEYNSHLVSLRFCILGGDALPLETLKKFEEKYKVLIYEGDGPTECSPVTAVNPIGGRRKIGSIGKAVPGVDMKIVDDNGKEIKRGKVGEIVVRGENVMKGYFNRPEETEEAFFGEYFRTGDIGYKDDEDYFYIVDRKKDTIIVSGMNVYPRMVENVIRKHPAVSEVAVVPAPHPLHNEIPRAVIVLKEGKTATAKEIIHFCSKYLGRHEIPRIVEFVSELPKTPTGKVLKRELKSGIKKFHD